MTKAERLMLAHFIERCSSDLGNNSCNDFQVSDYIPDVKERRALAKAMHEQNGDPEEFDPKGNYDIMPDFWLVSFLGQKALRELSEQEAK